MTKILALSDQEVERLYALSASGYYEHVDLLLACGDLPYAYLEYLVGVLNVPLYYVPGNHDPLYSETTPAARVDGGINLDQRTARFNGLLLAGLGGSVRYRPDGLNQYSQPEMYGHILPLLPQLFANRLRYGRFLDILITHSPPSGVNDEKTRAHQGLKALNWLIGWARPRYHLHGHTHIYHRNLVPTEASLGHTKIINIYPYKLIEVPDER